jgi:hypothetical protein
MEIQGTLYAVDNQNRLPGMQGGQQTLPCGLSHSKSNGRSQVPGRTTLGWEVIWRRHLLPLHTSLFFILSIERAGGTALLTPVRIVSAIGILRQ